jgi:outer membrane protein TolC
MALAFITIKVLAQPLEEYLVEAAENNPQLRASFNEYLAALEKVPQMGSLPDPQLTFGYFTKPMEYLMGNQRAELSLMQMFPWFGTLRYQKDEASQMANARYQLFLENKNQLYYQVKETWFDMYGLEAEIQLMEENIELLRTLERIAMIRFRSGGAEINPGNTERRNLSPRSGESPSNQGMPGMGAMDNRQAPTGTSRSASGGMGGMSAGAMGSGGGMVDVLRAQMEIKELESRIAMLRDSKKPLISRFNRLLNRPSDRPVLIADTLSAQSLPLDRLTLLDSAMMNNPMIRMYESEMQAYEAQREMARREGYPMIGAGFNYMVFSPRAGAEGMAMGGQNMLMPMVSVTIPINRKRYRAMQKEAELLRESAQLRQTGEKNQLSVLWEEAMRDLDDAERRIGLYQDQETLAGQAQRLITTSYSAGTAGFDEVLRVQQQMIDYRLSLINAIIDQNETIARIEMLAAINLE